MSPRASVALTVLFLVVFPGAIALGQAQSEGGSEGLSPLMPDAAGHYNVELRTKSAGKPVTLPCRLFLPNNYEKAKDPWPLLIFLHSEKERGSDLAALVGVGPERMLRQDWNWRNGFKMIALSPQCPADAAWEDPAMVQAVLALAQEAGRHFRVDPERVYLTGLGMGGTGAWRIAAAGAARFAAIAVNSGQAVAPEELGAKLRHLPTHIVAPPSDKDALAGLNRMFEAIANAQGEAQFAHVGNNRDECAQQFYGNGQTYEWFLKHKRRSDKDRQERDDKFAVAAKEALAKLPGVPGNHKLVHETWVGTQKITMPYLLYLPKNYDKSKAVCPTLLYLHGAGEGDRNLQGQFGNGPGVELTRNERFRDGFPCIVVFPVYDNQPHNITAVARLLEDVCRKFRVDTERVYLTGLSQGGTGSWLVALEAPERFAAIAPLAGRAVNPQQVGERLKYLSVWAIVGTSDGDYTTGMKAMAESIRKAGGDVQLSLVPGAGHDIWPRYYYDQRFYDWLLAHRRLTPAERQARDRRDPAAPTPFPQQAGQYKLQFQATVAENKTVSLTYGLQLPRGYGQGQERWPALLCLHDLADRGTDLPLIFNWGQPVQVGVDAQPFPAPPLVAVAPLCPPDRRWEEPEMVKAVLLLMDDLGKKLRLDEDRLYLAGSDFGGAATWQYAVAAPERFAAIATTNADAFEPDKSRLKLKYTAAWIKAVGNERGVAESAKRMGDALTRVKGDVRLNLVANPAQAPGRIHYADRELLDWMMARRRVTPKERQEREYREAREFPLEPGLHRRIFETKVAGRTVAFGYVAFVPAGYDPGKDAWPAIISLHSEKERGADLNLVAGAGLPKLLTTNEGWRNGFKNIVIAPQIPAGAAWEDAEPQALVLALGAALPRQMRVDPDRVHLMGVGIGAAGAWRAALQADAFGALLLNSPVAVALDDAARLKHLATYVSASPNDGPSITAYRWIIQALKRGRGDVTFAQIGGSADESPWHWVNDGRTWDWLSKQRRRGEKEKQEREKAAVVAASDAPALPATPGFHKLSHQNWFGERDVVTPYLLYLPRDYDKTQALHPCIVFMHGGGEGGADLQGMFAHGPAAVTQNVPGFKDWSPFILLCPICDGSWEMARAVVEVVELAKQRWRIDPDRVFLTGLSHGGTNTWKIALQSPDTFAGIVPVSGRAVEPQQAPAKLKYVTTWIVTGGADGDYTVGANQMFEELTKGKADVYLSVFPGDGHGTWGRYYPDQRLYEWMLQQRRKSPAERAAWDQRDPAKWTPQHGNHRLKFRTSLGGKPFEMRCGLYLPKGHGKPDARWPLMLYLHPEWDRHHDLSMLFNYGSDADPWKPAKDRFNFPMIGLAPQLPPDKPWQDPEVIQAILALLAEVSGKFRVDPDRVYLTGFEAGGVGTWRLALASPDTFAAIVPAFAPAVEPAQAGPKLKYLATRVIVPGGDGGAMQAFYQMMNPLRQNRAVVRLSLLDRDGNKWPWKPYYTQPALVDWLLAHRRLTAQQRQERDAADARNNLAQAPKTPGACTLAFETIVGGRLVKLSYRLSPPKDYEKNANRYPMLLYLHGASETGDGPAGPDLARAKDQKLAEPFPLISVSPRCPQGRSWDEPDMVQALLALIDEMVCRFRAEEERVCAVGLERGANALWQAAALAPERFAAIVPIALTIQPDQVPDSLARVSTWLVAGAADGQSTETAKQLAEMLKKKQAVNQLTLLPIDLGAGRWQTLYSDPKFYQWLLGQRRR